MNKTKLIQEAVKELSRAPDFHKDSFDAGVMVGFHVGFPTGFLFGAGYSVICMLAVAVVLWLFV